jgi:hypothetical protein
MRHKPGLVLLEEKGEENPGFHRINSGSFFEEGLDGWAWGLVRHGDSVYYPCTFSNKDA